MAIGINPTVDFAFKKLLGSPEHPAITIHFLNSVLGGDPKITEVEILNPILDKEFDGDKVAILDVLARDERGRLFNVEMQTSQPAGLRERLAFYAASLFVGQMREGHHYLELNPAIGICVLDAIMFHQTDEICHDFRLRSESGQLLLTNQMQIHVLELPKYSPPSDNQLISDAVEQWSFFFRRAEDLGAEEVQSRLSDPVFAEATGVLEMIARNPYERSQYELRLKAQRDEQARIIAATEQGLEQGLEQGRSQGRIELLQQLLGSSEPSMDELQKMTLADLALLEGELQRQLRDRA